MSVYNPDVWVLVKIQSPGNEEYYRILGGWYGGYAGADYWRLSSGVNRVVDKDSYFEVYNHSGSLYNCPKHAEKLSLYTQSIFSRYEQEAKSKDWVFEIVPMKDYLLST
jgi:hypothetical protein